VRDGSSVTVRGVRCRGIGRKAGCAGRAASGAGCTRPEARPVRPCDARGVVRMAQGGKTRRVHPVRPDVVTGALSLHIMLDHRKYGHCFNTLCFSTLRSGTLRRYRGSRCLFMMSRRSMLGLPYPLL
jgi:hypothetical protein